MFGMGAILHFPRPVNSSRCWVGSYGPFACARGSTHQSTGDGGRGKNKNGRIWPTANTFQGQVAVSVESLDQFTFSVITKNSTHIWFCPRQKVQQNIKDVASMLLLRDIFQMWYFSVTPSRCCAKAVQCLDWVAALASWSMYVILCTFFLAQLTKELGC